MILSMHTFMYNSQNNTLELRLYLFLQDMYELIQVNNGLY